MKLLVITATTPLRSLTQLQGITRRMKLFMDAFRGLVGETHIAHLVPRSEIAQDNRDLEERQSQFWGMPLKLTLLPRGNRAETWRNHYWDGLWKAHDQPLVYPYAGPEQANAVGQLLDQDFDLVFVHRLPAMCAVLRSGRRPKNTFFDLDDVEHLARLRYATGRPRWPGKLAYAAHVPALLAAERQGISLARQTFVCSSRDKAVLAKWSSGDRIAVVPNALQLPRQPAPFSTAPTLLFLGACDYPPNAEAAERLVNRILPLIRKSVPEACLLIAGRGSENLSSRKAEPDNVEYLGYVEDLDALYARTRVVCAPISNGGGTRIKLIEGAAYGRAMVATHIGAEGLEFADERDILLRDNDEDFAAACVTLLQDEQTCIRLGLAARARVETLYQAENVSDAIRNLILNHLQ